MPRGKKGPTPNIDPKKIDEIVPPEATATDEIPVIDGQFAEVDETTNGAAPAESSGDGGKLFWYACRTCSFRSDYELEAEEHENGTEHECDLVEKEAVQSELFSEPDTVIRQLRGHMSDSRIAELNQQLVGLYQQKVEQTEAMKLAKERVKGLEAEMLEIGAKLRDPFEMMAVPCKWQISESGNEKSLIRLDTNEVLETKALSMEDRQAEAERVLSGNQNPEPKAAEEPVAVEG